MVDALLGFFLGVVAVVLAAQSLLVFAERARALVADVVNPAEMDVRPHLGPFWRQIAGGRVMKRIGGRGAGALQEEQLADAVMRQGAVAEHIPRLLILREPL